MATNEELLQRIESLEARLRVTEDVQAIQRLKARYAELVDARYTRRDGVKGEQEVRGLAREIAGLFASDAVWDGGPGLGVCTGREAIYERMCGPTLQFSWHFFLKPQIEVQGDEARGRWDILSPCTGPNGRAMWMVGVEDDRYVRQDDVWLHQSMKLDLVFMAPYERGWAPRKPS